MGKLGYPTLINYLCLKSKTLYQMSKSIKRTTEEKTGRTRKALLHKENRKLRKNKISIHEFC